MFPIALLTAALAMTATPCDSSTFACALRVSEARAAGHVVAAAGDVDGDGRTDWVIGMPRHDRGGRSRGRAEVVSGADGSTLRSFEGDSPGDRFGWAVGGAGDLDRDGHADVIVGAPLDDPRGNASGSVRVFSGRDGSTLLLLRGEAPGEQLGHAVAGGRDLDGDGVPDVVVGAPFAGRRAGRVAVHSGADGSALLAIRGTRAWQRLGQRSGDLVAAVAPWTTARAPLLGLAGAR